MGPHAQRSITPFHIVFDTGAGINVIRRSALPNGWEASRVTNEELPNLGDANGQPFRVGGALKLYVRLRDAMYSTAFVFVEHLAVDVILGTTFMNRNVKSIECMRQQIRFRDDRTFPILSSDNVNTLEKDVDACVKEEGAKPEPLGPPNNFHTSNTDRLAKGVTIPAMAQLPVRGTTKVAGVGFLDPKMALLHRH